ncbi:gag/pol protein [Cucumis melo var. makuwa]|uniref:Gag/pol protein n=1 Tax=Cucumis melo var. makuwa TaxID=1194695 RepID=A0A5A7T6T3_CUCMM|nr:gag/pol protein [Cucumis melo var. makuwa]TYK13888.1 gag/pol protein [Cucumis melo var. makuwa]
MILVIAGLRFVLIEECPFRTQNVSQSVRDAYDHWTKASDKTCIYILVSMSDILSKKHEIMVTARQIMDSLRNMFGQSSIQIKQEAIKYVYNASDCHPSSTVVGLLHSSFHRAAELLVEPVPRRATKRRVDLCICCFSCCSRTTTSIIDCCKPHIRCQLSRFVNHQPDPCKSSAAVEPHALFPSHGHECLAVSFHPVEGARHFFSSTARVLTRATLVSGSRVAYYRANSLRSEPLVSHLLSTSYFLLLAEPNPLAKFSSKISDVPTGSQIVRIQECASLGAGVEIGKKKGEKGKGLTTAAEGKGKAKKTSSFKQLEEGEMMLKVGTGGIISARAMGDEYKAEVENLLSKKIKILRSDRGGDYIDLRFQNYMIEHGIQFQLSAPGTPQQNGVSERRNRTLLYMVRLMMSYAQLLSSFKGRKPSLSHFRIWGCLAHVLVTNPKKLEPRSRLCQFVGYPKETRGGLFFDPQENRVVIPDDGVEDPLSYKQAMNDVDNNQWVKAKDLEIESMYFNSVCELIDLFEGLEGFITKVRSKKHGVHLSKEQCPKTPREAEDMRCILYASTVGSLTYAMLCTSIKERCIADSTMEAEYVATGKAAKEAV